MADDRDTTKERRVDGLQQLDFCLFFFFFLLYFFVEHTSEPAVQATTTLLQLKNKGGIDG
jgi:hypothetical protein